MSSLRKLILCGAVLISSLPALAQQGCKKPNPDEAFKTARFSDGSVVQVLERNNNIMRYRATPPNSASTEITVFAGTMTLHAQRPDGQSDFEWKQDIAALYPLEVGKHFHADGEVKGSLRSPQTLSMDIKRCRREGGWNRLTRSPAS